MAIIITNECINCGACEPACPNNAIYEGGVSWRMKDGTNLTGEYEIETGNIIGVSDEQYPLSVDYFYIVPDKCTECVGFHEEPQCAAVCPVDCCVPDLDRVESYDVLISRKNRLHLKF